jgi:hypothetical protein
VRKTNSAELIITSIASCGFIALAYYERTTTSYKLPPVYFFLAAAGICLLSVIHALYRHRSCGQRTCKE